MNADAEEVMPKTGSGDGAGEKHGGQSDKLQFLTAEANRSEERFRLLVEGILDYAIFMLDTDGKVVTWNIGAERIKSYKREEITGKHFSIFYLPDDVKNEKPRKQLAVARREGRVDDEGWRVRKNGERFWARVVITALHDSAGRLRGFAKVTQDLTQKHAEQELRESEAHLRYALAERERLSRDLHDLAGHHAKVDLAESLSPQEKKVLSLVAEGKTNKEIAIALELSDKTVKNYLSTVFQKLHVGRRARAAVIYRESCLG